MGEKRIGRSSILVGVLILTIGLGLGILAERYFSVGRLVGWFPDEAPAPQWNASGTKLFKTASNSPTEDSLKPPRDLSSSAHEYVLRLYDRRSREWAFHGRTPEEFALWRRETRDGLKSLLKLNVAKTPLNLERIPVKETPEYRMERLYYNTRPDLVATAFFILPKKGPTPHPVVLCPPGHGKGMEEVLFDEKRIYHAYPFKLVERGLACVIPENLSFGERAIRGSKFHRFIHDSLAMTGQSALGAMVWDLIRAMDVIETLPEVDATRAGCYGLSLGGELTMLLAAVDGRVKVACISGFLSSYRMTFLSAPHCSCGYVPKMAIYLEHEDIAALIAPRPLFIESGREDPLIPLNAATKAFSKLKKVYELLGRPENLEQDIHPGKHEISGRKAFDWLEKELGGDDIRDSGETLTR